MKPGRTLVVLVLVPLLAACGGGAGDGSTSSPSTTASAGSVTTIDGIVAFLAGKGIACSHVDIENEPGGGLPGDAMCYRDGARTLELLLYAGGATRDTTRARASAIPCADVPTMRALDGLAMSVAEGDGFDVRAADSSGLTPTSLTALNAETEKVAAATGTRIGRVTFRCTTSSVGATKIATGRSPGGIAFDGRALWVTSNRDGIVSRLDPATGARSDIRTGANPADVVFDGTAVWVANIASGTLTRVDPKTGTTTSLAVATPAGLYAAAGSLWVRQPPAREGDTPLLRVDPVAMTVTPFAAGRSPLAVTFDGTHVWVTDPPGGSLWRLDPRTGARTELKVGGAPGAIAFDGTDLWITDSSRASVSRIVPSTGARTDFATPTPASAVFHDRGRLYVSASTTLSVIDVATGTRADHQLESSVGDVVVAANEVWVTLPLQDAVARLVL